MSENGEVHERRKMNNQVKIHTSQLLRLFQWTVTRWAVLCLHRVSSNYVIRQFIKTKCFKWNLASYGISRLTMTVLLIEKLPSRFLQCQVPLHRHKWRRECWIHPLENVSSLLVAPSGSSLSFLSIINQLAEDAGCSRYLGMSNLIWQLEDNFCCCFSYYYVILNKIHNLFLHRFSLNLWYLKIAYWEFM